MKTEGAPVKAFVIQREDRVILVTPYDQEFVAAMKRFPSRWRAFDHGLKTWTIREPYVEDAVALANQRFKLEFLVPAE